MSLDWSIAKVENKDACYDGNGELSAVTRAVIWTTFLIDMGEITEKNYMEFAARARVAAERFDAPMLCESSRDVAGTLGVSGAKVSRAVTVEEVRRHIGLSTNVATKTRQQWARRMARSVERLTLRDIGKYSLTGNGGQGLELIPECDSFIEG